MDKWPKYNLAFKKHFFISKVKLNIFNLSHPYVRIYLMRVFCDATFLFLQAVILQYRLISL